MVTWGKDPFAAVVAAIELVGPCRFGEWATRDYPEKMIFAGDPIGVSNPNAWVQVAAVSKDQSQNTMKLFQQLFSDSCKDRYLVEVGKEVVYAFGGQRVIQAVTRSPRALEGNRPSFVIMNEPHHWLENNEGHEMAKAIRRNVAKSKGGAARTLSITNAYAPGEHSVGQIRRETYESGIQQGRTPKGMGVLYDSVEAPKTARLMLPPHPADDGEEPEAATEEEIRAYIGAVVDSVRGDAWYLDVDRLVAEIMDEETSTEESRRFYYNQVVADENQWVDPKAVVAAVDPRAADAATAKSDPLRDRWVVGPDDPIVMFFDGSKSLDSSALVGCRVSDGHVFLIGIWQRPPGALGKNWRAPRPEITQRVREAFERFNVIAFWGDPSHAQDDDGSSRYWDGTFDEWHREFRDTLKLWAVKSGDSQHSIMWDMTSPSRSEAFTSAAQQFVEEMERRNDIEEFDPEFTICGHPVLLNHLRNAVEAPTKWGTSLSKPTRRSRRKVDAAVCAVGARMLRRYILNAELDLAEQSSGGAFWSY